MKKIIAGLLALLMMFSVTAVFAEADEEPSHLTVGNPTPMRGDFFTGMWGNATSDMDVRDLIHGYNLVRWDGGNGMFTADSSAVNTMVATANEAGDHTYIFVLQNDLKYSDGSKITAWDYAFSMLLEMAPEIAELGGTPNVKEYILGSKAYLDGSAKTLAGVRVTADDILTITLSHEYLPFFYEVGLLSCNPYPIKEIAPGATVKDDGDGIYLDGAISAEALNSYRSNPKVVSGPYTLTSWDGTTAEFAVNPNYKGNYAGQKPSIKTLTYTAVSNDTAIDQLENYDIDLLNKALRADVLAGGIELAEDEVVQMTNYPRTGLGYIRFNLKNATVASRAVRQAIAWSMDRDQVTMGYAGEYGSRMDGYYGVGQWMYRLINGIIEPPKDEKGEVKDKEEYEALNLDNLTVYGPDAAKAAELLDGDGWTLNADGIREKDGTALNLKLLIPEGNTIGKEFEEYLVPNLEQVGIKLEIETLPMAELLSAYYGQSENSADMIFLASNFDLIFDPTPVFADSVENEDGKALYDLAVAMRSTKAGDVLGYMKNWVAFQEKFNECLVMIPIYGNTYFDFYTDELQNYKIDENTTWAQAIVGARLGEEEEEP